MLCVTFVSFLQIGPEVFPQTSFALLVQLGEMKAVV